MPATLPAAVELSLIENPNVTAAMFGIDVNFLQVKVNEGALLPTVTVAGLGAAGQPAKCYGTSELHRPALAQLSVPIYQGGAEYSLIRQSKEIAGAAAPRSRTDPRPDPRQHRNGVGAIGGGQGPGGVGPGAGDRI